jgi:hypothetical protein
VSRGHRNGSSLPYFRLSRPESLLFLPSSSSVVLTRLSGPPELLIEPLNRPYIYISIYIKM